MFQIHKLVSELCRQYNVTIPSELTRLAPPDDDDMKDEGQGSDMESEDEAEELVEVVYYIAWLVLAFVYNFNL